MEKNIEAIAGALREANEYIQQFRSIEDRGTCNMDSVVIYFTGWRQKDVDVLMEASGVDIGDKLSSKYWKNGRFINFDISGQANRRNKMVEEANKFLKQKGIDSSIYYQMD